jgi:cytochrome c-type biogenesis protein
MEDLFTILTHAVEGTPALAVGAAFVWGILSVILSPCHLASIPLVVGFINGQGRISARRAFGLSSLFALGILATIGAIAGITAGAGRMLGDVGSTGNYAVAAVFFAAGLYLLDVLPAPWSGPAQVRMRKRGMAAALVLGLIFGVALGPCTFAYMAPVLGVTFKAASTRFVYASALLLSYGIGHCSVIVLAGTSTELVERYLNWSETSKEAIALKRACGILVIAGGLWLIYSAR